MGGSSSTTISPSPSDQTQADVATQFSNLIMPLLQAGMSGNQIPGQATQNTNLTQQAKGFGANMGVSSNAPQWQDFLQKMNESLTMPNPQAPALAMQMEGLSQTPQTANSTTSTNPGLLGEVSSVGSLGLMSAMLASML